MTEELVVVDGFAGPPADNLLSGAMHAAGRYGWAEDAERLESTNRNMLAEAERAAAVIANLQEKNTNQMKQILDAGKRERALLSEIHSWLDDFRADVIDVSDDRFVRRLVDHYGMDDFVDEYTFTVEVRGWIDVMLIMPKGADRDAARRAVVNHFSDGVEELVNDTSVSFDDDGIGSRLKRSRPEVDDFVSSIRVS